MDPSNNIMAVLIIQNLQYTGDRETNVQHQFHHILAAANSHLFHCQHFAPEILKVYLVMYFGPPYQRDRETNTISSLLHQYITENRR